MPMLDELRLKTGQLVTEDWFTKLVDYLEQLGYGGIISIYGYVMRDLVPVEDLLINLGIPLRNFKELHVGSAYIKDAGFIAGKAILKDGDPITVTDLGSSAQSKIQTAVSGGLDASTDIETIKTKVTSIDSSTSGIKSDTAKLDISLSTHKQGIVDKLDSIDDKLDAFPYVFKPILLGSVIEAQKDEGADVFPSDLILQFAGRARFKMTFHHNVYAYVKHRASGSTIDVISLLNGGDTIPFNAWHEFDFTVMNNDRVNLRISPSTTVTVFVYNIPNA